MALLGLIFENIPLVALGLKISTDSIRLGVLKHRKVDTLGVSLGTKLTTGATGRKVEKGGKNGLGLISGLDESALKVTDSGWDHHQRHQEGYLLRGHLSTTNNISTTPLHYAQIHHTHLHHPHLLHHPPPRSSIIPHLYYIHLHHTLQVATSLAISPKFGTTPPIPSLLCKFHRTPGICLPYSPLYSQGLSSTGKQAFLRVTK